MELTKVQITDFRSIQTLELEFEHRLQVLTGINESGKSNILKALRLLDPEFEFPSDDVRYPTDGTHIESSSVKFELEVSSSELAVMSERVLNRLFAGYKELPYGFEKVTDQKTEAITLKKFLEDALRIIRVRYTRDSRGKEHDKKIEFINLKSGPDIVAGTIPNWYRVNDDCPETITVDIEGQQHKLDTIFYISKPNDVDDTLIESIEDHLSLVNSSVFMDDISRVFKGFAAEYFPEIIDWRYSDKYLLPNSIDIETFCSNPDICLPLKHIFMLASVSDPAADLRPKLGNPLRLQNFLQNIALSASLHVASVWKDYTKIEFSIQSQGALLTIGVTDHQSTIGMVDRSDGFKRFITFLLMISARARTGSLDNSLLLLDEPDTSLHPSGIRHLLSELLHLSKNNTIIASTHSIFMIDSTVLERHIVVKKTNGKTLVERCSYSRHFSEEVIYRALGASIFDVLKRVNLIFEGWSDRQLFIVATRNSDHFDLCDIGQCHLEGIGDVKKLLPILELAGRSSIVISDGDQASVRAEADTRDARTCSDWHRYDSVTYSDGLSRLTAEDFVDASIWRNTLIQVLSPRMAEDTVGQLAKTPSPRLKALEIYLAAASIHGDDAKIIKRELKRIMFSSLASEAIAPAYSEFLKGLSGRVEKLKVG